MLVEEAIGLLKQQGHPAWVMMLLFLANIRWIQDRPEEAVAVCDQLAAIGTEIGDPFPVQLANLIRGAIDIWLGDYAHARACIDQALPFLEAAGAMAYAAFALHSQALLSHVDGDLDTAAAPFERLFEIHEATGHRNMLVVGLSGAGWLALDRDEIPLALERFAGAIKLALDREAWGMVIFGAEGLAAARMDLNDREQALRLFALSALLHERYCPAYWSKRDELDVAARVERLRHEIEPARFSELWAEGQAMHPARVLDPA